MSVKKDLKLPLKRGQFRNLNRRRPALPARPALSPEDATVQNNMNSAAERMRREREGRESMLGQQQTLGPESIDRNRELIQRLRNSQQFQQPFLNEQMGAAVSNKRPRLIGLSQNRPTDRLSQQPPVLQPQIEALAQAAAQQQAGIIKPPQQPQQSQSIGPQQQEAQMKAQMYQTQPAQQQQPKPAEQPPQMAQQQPAQQPEESEEEKKRRLEAQQMA